MRYTLMSGFIGQLRVGGDARKIVECESRQIYEGMLILLPVMQSGTPPTDWAGVMMRDQNENGRRR